MDSGLQFLVAKLEHLLKLPIGSKAELTAWSVESRSLQQTLRQRFPDLKFPDEIWHFLADAEIRAGDAGYRQYQEQIVADYIKKVRGESHAV